MKNTALTVEQMMKWKGLIESGQSVGIVQIGNKAYTVKSVTHYVSAFVSQLLNGELLLVKNVATPGIRSIDRNMLGAGVNFLGTSLRVLSDTSQALETDAAIITLPWATTAPSWVKNGELAIGQGSELFRSVGTDVSNWKASTGNDDDFRDIACFQFRPQSPTSIKFTLPTGAAAPAAGSAIRVEIRGLEFVETSIQ